MENLILFLAVVVLAIVCVVAIFAMYCLADSHLKKTIVRLAFKLVDGMATIYRDLRHAFKNGNE